MPEASQSRGYALVAVKPGIVLISFTSTPPVVLDEEVHARHPGAVDRLKGLHGERPHRSVVSGGSAAGTLNVVWPAPYLVS